MDISFELNKYIVEQDKIFCLTNLSILQLCSENSAFSGLLSELAEFCMLKSRGKIQNSISDFGVLLNKEIAANTNRIPPQESLFVDCVHANHKTFRVFPGQFCNFQKAINRLFNICIEQEIKCNAVNTALTLLSISDMIATKLSFARYEIGYPENEYITVPTDDNFVRLQEAVIIKPASIFNILRKYCCTFDNFNQFVINEEEKYSPNSSTYIFPLLEKRPFLKLGNGDYLLLQPSALLSSAFYILQSLFQNELKDNWYELYKKEVIKGLLYTKALINYRSMGMGEADGQPSLLYRVDKDKILCIQTILNQKTVEAYRLFNDGIIHYLENKYPDCEIMVVLAVEILGQYGFLYNSGENDVIILLVDELDAILNTDNFSPLELWYYAEDKKNSIIKLQGQEIDLFSFYYNNQRTFYSNIPQSSSTIFQVAIGNALQLRYENAKVEDSHFVNLEYSKLLVERYADISKDIPVYVPFRDSSKNTFIGEYRKGKLICSVKKDNSSDRLKEIVKSILLWIYCIEYKTDTALLETNVTICFSFYESDNYKVDMETRKNDIIVFKYFIPYSKVDDFSQDNLEKQLVYSLIDELNEYKVQVNSEYKSLIDYTFYYCKGHIFQGTNQFDVLLNPDGETGIYNISKRCCEKLLDDISRDVLNNYERGIILSVQNSKETAIKIQTYIENKLKTLLSEIANEDFIVKLLKLHHAFQFWKELGRARFKGINDFLSNFNGKYENQKTSAISYTEGDNATCYIIESVIKNGYNTTTNIVPSYDNLNMIFACAALLYNIGMYLDVLSVRKEKAKLDILESGRFCFPLKEMELFERYFTRLREEAFDDSYKYKKKLEKFPELDVDTKSSVFMSAFKEEYGINYTTLNHIIRKCLEYSLTQNITVCIMPEEKFLDIFFRTEDKSCYSFFKKKFVLSKDSAEGLQYSEFFPQRYNRLFQLSTRPWVLYNGKILYSYKSLYIAYTIFLERLSNGILRVSSKEMKKFLGSIRKEKGQMFNKQMFELYSNIGRNKLKIFQNVNIGKGEVLENDNTLGDIDILLIDTNSGKIVCVELKNYMESRSLWSVIIQDRETEDDMESVIKRDEWCRNHVPLLKKFARIEDDKKYMLKTVFLTCNLQAHKFFTSNEDYSSNIVLMDVSQIIESPLEILNV